MSESELGNSEAGLALRWLGYHLGASHMSDNWARRN